MAAVTRRRSGKTKLTEVGDTWLGSMLRIRRRNGTETDASQRREGRIVAGKQNASQEKRTGSSTVSSFFLMLHPVFGPLVYG